MTAIWICIGVLAETCWTLVVVLLFQPEDWDLGR